VSLPTLSVFELTAEVEDSRRILSQLVDEEIAGFAYPYGHCGDREIAAVRAAGYRHACGVGRATPGSTHAIWRSFIGQRDTEPRLVARQLRHQPIWRRLR
jgi:peptidoglycan/xylan/chitin deacetylase (PgdA/CDA1 family)